MDLSHLESDESRIECEVRHIAASPSSGEVLQSMLLAEKQFPILVPGVPHDLGLRNPAHEARLCGLKLSRIRTYLACDSSIEITDLPRVSSRLLHIQGRLNRLLKQGLETERAADLLQKCDELRKNMEDLRVNGIFCDSLSKNLNLPVPIPPYRSQFRMQNVTRSLVIRETEMMLLGVWINH